MRADLRVQKTRQMLYQALVELMEKYPFNKIKVVQLVQQSGVSKDTFYRHYDTIYDLYYEMMEQEVERVNGAFYDSTDGYQNDRDAAVKHVKAVLENQRVWRVALRETSPNILIELLVKHFERTAQKFHNGRPDLQYQNPVTDGNIDLFRRFGCATEVMSIRYFIDNADKSPEELAERNNENFVAFGESAMGSDFRKEKR